MGGTYTAECEGYRRDSLSLLGLLFPLLRCEQRVAPIETIESDDATYSVDFQSIDVTNEWRHGFAEDNIAASVNGFPINR